MYRIACLIKIYSSLPMSAKEGALQYRGDCCSTSAHRSSRRRSAYVRMMTRAMHSRSPTMKATREGFRIEPRLISWYIILYNRYAVPSFYAGILFCLSSADRIRCVIKGRVSEKVDVACTNSQPVGWLLAFPEKTTPMRASDRGRPRSGCC